MLEMLKLILGITDDTQDDYLNSLLGLSQGYVENYLDRKLDVDTYEDYVEVNQRSTIDLRQYPAIKVNHIENLDGNEIEDYRLVKPSGRIRLNRIIDGDFVVEYEAGYDPLPAWAQKAIVDTAVALNGQAGSGGSGSAGGTGAIKSEEIVGVAKVTYDTGSSSSGMFSVGGDNGSVGMLPFSVVQMLEPHKNRYA
jgi:hypothetical protein